MNDDQDLIMRQIKSFAQGLGAALGKNQRKSDQPVIVFHEAEVSLASYQKTLMNVIREKGLVAAQCDEFIDRLPQGYDTNIGENGSKLSGGERQRISIARALLKNAPVILLDEATASMDAESETMVQTALSALLKGRTVIVIAHRMRTIANADKIVVLDKGKVTEVGTPSELAKKGGLYAHLVALQQKQQMSSLPT